MEPKIVYLDIVRSPCSDIPDTPDGCHLLPRIKDNPICANCTARLDLGPINSLGVDRRAMAKVLDKGAAMDTTSIAENLDEARLLGITRYYGTVCKYHHVVMHNGEEHSVRRLSSGMCVECQKAHNAKIRATIAETRDDAQRRKIGKYYGTVCHNKHITRHNGHDYSVRYPGSGNCVECHSERIRALKGTRGRVNR